MKTGLEWTPSRLRGIGVVASVGALAILSITACDRSAGSSPDAAEAADAVRVDERRAAGAAVFARACATCHGAGATGMPGIGSDLTTSAFVATASDRELLELIRDGRPASHPENTTGVEMPPRGGDPMVSDEDLADLVVYLRSIDGASEQR